VVHLNVPTCNDKNLVSLIYVNAIYYCFNVNSSSHNPTLLGCSCSDVQPNHGFCMNLEDQNLIVDTKYQQILCQLIMAMLALVINSGLSITVFFFFFQFFDIAGVLITHKVV